LHKLFMQCFLALFLSLSGLYGLLVGSFCCCMRCGLFSLLLLA
jgi:hypothetical protein